MVLLSATPKKAPRSSSGALLCRAKDALVNYNKVRIARADQPFRVYKAVHVNRDPAAVYEDEVRVSDEPEMVRPKSLDEELLRMPPKTEYFTVTGSELLLVHRRFLARTRTRSSFTLVHVLSIRLSTYVCVRLRFCLRFVRRLRGAHVLRFWRRCRLRFVRLPLRLLRFR